MPGDLLINTVKSDGNELMTKSDIVKTQFKADNNGFHVTSTCDIDGVHTEFVFHRFTNKWFLLITQFSGIANMYTVRFDIQSEHRIQSSIHGPVDDPKLHASVPVTMNCKFGSDTDEIRSGIQFLVNKTALNRCPKDSFVISLGLKSINGKNLRETAVVLNSILT